MAMLGFNPTYKSRPSLALVGWVKTQRRNATFHPHCSIKRERLHGNVGFQPNLQERGGSIGLIRNLRLQIGVARAISFGQAIDCIAFVADIVEPIRLIFKP